jgi:dipeptidyl aminopeptidase/acylaminoacyl peptidase
MDMKKVLVLLIVSAGLMTVAVGWYIRVNTPSLPSLLNPTPQVKPLPIYIESLKDRKYPGSPLRIEETLGAGGNYRRYIASYLSDGYRIYGLLTVPDAKQPEGGFPVILFLHGYIRPDAYETTADYVASQDALARAGFITYKPDFRGHGKSEGIATSAHFSEVYVVDTLNALSSLRTRTDVNPARIGVWGHSNGGEIGLRSMVVSKDIRSGVFWAGVVGSFKDMLETYNDRIPFMKRTPELVEKYGMPSTNPEFWDRLDPYNYLSSISGPLQLHHGTSDPQVPHELSIHLKTELEDIGRQVEYYEYEGADHNFSGTYFQTAMDRTVRFFEKTLSAPLAGE